MGAASPVTAIDLPNNEGKESLSLETETFNNDELLKREADKVEEQIEKIAEKRQQVASLESSQDVKIVGKELKVASQRPNHSKIISHWSLPSAPGLLQNTSMQGGSPQPVLRYHSARSPLGITALLEDHATIKIQEIKHSLTSSLSSPPIVSVAMEAQPSIVRAIPKLSSAPPIPLLPPAPPVRISNSVEVQITNDQTSQSTVVPLSSSTKQSSAPSQQQGKLLNGTDQSSPASSPPIRAAVPPPPPSLASETLSAAVKENLLSIPIPPPLLISSTSKVVPCLPPSPPPPPCAPTLNPISRPLASPTPCTEPALSLSESGVLASPPPPPPPCPPILSSKSRPLVSTQPVPPPPPPPPCAMPYLSSSRSLAPPPPPPSPCPLPASGSRCKSLALTPAQPPPLPCTVSAPSHAGRPLASTPSPPPPPRGFSQGTLPPMANGPPRSNGPAPPAPNPPAAPVLAKRQVLSYANVKNQFPTKKTNMKPYHWFKLTRAMQGSLWAEAQKSGELLK